MNVIAIRTRVFREAGDLVEFILSHVQKPPEKSVIVVTSKIVALAEGRTAPLRNKVRIIKQESEFALKTKHTWLTVREGAVLANAGVDESNANGKLILLPKDSFAAAQTLRLSLRKAWKRKHLGVLITDSRLMPLRAGVVGIALGYAGFKGLRDYRGKHDIFGKKLQMSQTDVADSLATAAVLEMGEGKERMPLCVISGARIMFTDATIPTELLIDIKDDVYGPLFRRLRD